jgi:hypothetical protein
MLKHRKRKVFFTKETKLHDGTSEANKNFYLFIIKYLEGKIITVPDVACSLTNKEIFCYIQKTSDILLRFIHRKNVFLREPSHPYIYDKTEAYWENNFWENVSRTRQQKILRISILKNGSRDFQNLIEYSNYSNIKKLNELLCKTQDFLLPKRRKLNYI